MRVPVSGGDSHRTLLRSVFSRLQVDAVWAQTMAVNMRSRRVLERGGLLVSVPRPPNVG